MQEKQRKKKPKLILTHSISRERITMISLLSKIFIKNRTEYSNASVRSAYGVLCGIAGIVLNFMLFLAKLAAGAVSGSVAITADACNNLSDAGSSVVTLLGFKLASQKPDKDHPFGHGRFEYISGLIVAFLIIYMGFGLAQSSFDKIIHPGEIETGILSIAILFVSVAVKLYMFFYNRSIGKKISSSAMCATASDSISDAAATSVIIISMFIAHFTGINIDGLCGLAVSVFIVIAGIKAAKETISPLLGEPPSEEFVAEIRRLVMSYPEVLGIHDLIVHDYGPGRVMVSLHAEVSENADLLATHDVIDNIEKNLSERLECSAVIHMDPIASRDEETLQMRRCITDFIGKEFGGKLTLHDFRMVKGPTHTNVIFDVVVPFDVDVSNETVKSKINDYLSTFDKRYFAVITIDRSYIQS